MRAAGLNVLRGPGRVRAAVLLAVGLAAASGGCAAVTNPVAEGVPVRLVPPELLVQPRCAEETLPLNLLRQPAAAEYRLAGGDVLGVYVEGYLGDKTVPLPVHVGPLVQQRDQRRQGASLGYPVPVQDDGTIDLPGVDTIPVQGLTVNQAREAIRQAYFRKALAKPEVFRLIVNLLEPRRYTVLVFREEALAFNGTPDLILPTSKRGSGFELELSAYQNDVLHALARTGGLPGTDAYNEVIVYRDCFHDEAGRAAVKQQIGAAPPGGVVRGLGACAVRIPLHHAPGAPPCVRPEDVVLGEGDVVYLAARDQEVFFTAGLLPPGVHVIPRDRDLDVVEAISLVRGPLINGAFGGSNLSGTLIQPGIGNPSPAQLTVIRKTPGGGQVSIIVDLNSALRHPSERILVKAGDMLVLQDLPGQAIARYLSQTVFNFNLLWLPFHGRNGLGVVDIGGADRLQNRGAFINLSQPQQ